MSVRLLSEIKHDLYRYTGVSKNYAFLKAIFSQSGARFSMLYRFCNSFSFSNPIGFFFRGWFKLLSLNKNVEIPHSTQIGKGIYFGHFKNIVINQNAQIGENCNIYQGVTIGRESRGKRKGSPVIGDRVFIGPNSVVVGNITVGNDVLIAPLTFVNFDVPANSVVVGSPGKIVRNSGSRGYVNKIRNLENFNNS